jgi:hypothetical protein
VDPAAEVLSTMETQHDRPDPVSALLGLALDAGWQARAGYSRGQARTRSVGRYKVVETFGVWAVLDEWRWYAMYQRTILAATGWTWDRTAIWRPDGRSVAPGMGSRFTHANVTDLKDFIVSPVVTPAWFKAVHARVTEQAEQARARARARPATKKPREGMS